MKLQRVEVSASGNVQPVEPPQAKQTPSRAHSLADLCTPQRVYAADASPADLRAPARQRKGVVTSEKTRTVAVGKSIVSDLRAALTLMRCIADGHAQSGCADTRKTPRLNVVRTGESFMGLSPSGLAAKGLAKGVLCCEGPS